MTMALDGGRNIAVKVPAHLYEATVSFYRDVAGLKPLDQHLPHICFEFGANQLWIDRCDGRGQTEVWLELVTDDIPAAARHLAQSGVTRCDAVEKLPDGFDGFWIASPASTVHLVAQKRSHV